MSSWQKKISGLIGWLFCLAYAGLYFSLPVSNGMLFLLIAGCLLTFKPTQWKRVIAASWPIKLMLLFYLVHIAGLLYTENMSNGLFVLEKKATLLVLPLILFPSLQHLHAGEKSNIILRIGVITIASSILFILIAVSKKVLYHYSLAFHPDYFSSIPYVFYGMYFATGSLLLLVYLYERGPHKLGKIAGSALLIAYSLGALIIIGSKTGIISYVFGLMLFLYSKLRSKISFIISLAAVALVLSAFLLSYSPTLERFAVLPRNLSVLSVDTLEDQQEFTGLNLRLFIWKTAIVQLWEDNLLAAGVGTGDQQDYLDMAYEKRHLEQYGFIHFDPHNQWITTLLQLGAVGVLLFAATVFAATKKGVKGRDLGYLIFAAIGFCYTFSESILESNKGVVFFALMFCLMVTNATIPTPSQANPPETKE